MLDQISINDCEFSVRVINCLQAYGRYKTLGDLDAASDTDLLAIPQFGRKCVREVRELIAHVKYSRPNNADLIEWVMTHENLVRALMRGEARIVAND